MYSHMVRRYQPVTAVANWLGSHRLYSEAFEEEFCSFARITHRTADEMGSCVLSKYRSTRITDERAYFENFCLDRSEAGMGDRKWRKLHRTNASRRFSIQKGAKAEAHLVK